MPPAASNNPAGSFAGLIRCFRRHGVGRPIALLACKPLGPSVPKHEHHRPLTARLPPNSPPNQHRWSPGGRSAPAGHLAHVNRGLVTRVSSGASGHRRAADTVALPAKVQSNRSLRGERRRSDRKATTLCPCRAILSCSISGFHAFGTSVRVWDYADRSYPSHSTSRELRSRAV